MKNKNIRSRGKNKVPGKEDNKSQGVFLRRRESTLERHRKTPRATGKEHSSPETNGS